MQDVPTGLLREIELEINPRTAVDHVVNEFHPFELLYPALGLLGFGGFRLESFDEPLRLPDFGLLIFKRALLNLVALRFLFDVVRIIARVVIQFRPRHLHDGIDYVINKFSVVRYHNNGSFVILYVLFHPLNRR